MPRMKIDYTPDETEVVYNEEHWNLLRDKREKALEVCDPLNEKGIPLIIFGSTARGDVKPNSDLDIFINANLPPFQIELALESGDLQIIGKEIVQATPSDVVKGHIYLSDDVSITLFLSSATNAHFEFYKFGGAINFKEFEQGKRAPGVNKSLDIIIPTEKGHKKMSLLGNEKLACEIIGISPKIIEIRKRVLMKRDQIGRTGIFLKETIGPNDSFGETLQKLNDSNAFVRRKLNKS
jgi:uncharacterized protein